MDFNEIKQLIDIVNSSDLQETIIEEGDFKIILRRSSATVAPSLVPVTAAPALQASPQASNAAPAATKSEACI